jgi:hypothetical protein
MNSRHPLLALLVLGISCTAFRGDLYCQSMYAGIKGGLSIPSLRGGNSEISEGYSTRMGPDFGAYIGESISGAFGLQLELLYSSQGGAWGCHGSTPMQGPTSDFL